MKTTSTPFLVTAKSFTYQPQHLREHSPHGGCSRKFFGVKYYHNRGGQGTGAIYGSSRIVTRRCDIPDGCENHDLDAEKYQPFRQAFQIAPSAIVSKTLGWLCSSYVAVYRHPGAMIRIGAIPNNIATFWDQQVCDVGYAGKHTHACKALRKLVLVRSSLGSLAVSGECGLGYDLCQGLLNSM